MIPDFGITSVIPNLLSMDSAAFYWTTNYGLVIIHTGELELNENFFLRLFPYGDKRLI